jgi:hypothetical protein
MNSRSICFWSVVTRQNLIASASDHDNGGVACGMWQTTLRPGEDNVRGGVDHVGVDGDPHDDQILSAIVWGCELHVQRSEEDGQMME